jgi:uracil-DNA glycosylase
MVVGQDWGGVEYFTENEGLEKDDNETTQRLVELLAGIGIEINLPALTSDDRPLYFTNAVLCLRPGRLTGPISGKWFRKCGPLFLRRQIELVRPKVVVTLGYYAYRTVLTAFGRKPTPRMRDALIKEVPLYQCSIVGRMAKDPDPSQINARTGRGSKLLFMDNQTPLLSVQTWS